MMVRESSPAILTLKKLSVGYGKNILVRGVDFEVFQGDFVAIVGANGSGKSTLIKTILGLVPAISGKVIWNSGTVGYLPQNTQVENNFPATVSEIVLSGLLGKMKGAFYGGFEKKKAEAALSKLGILKLKRKSFSELSGGQRQKVLLARALVPGLGSSKSVLILDEPSNNLDYNSREEFYRTLKELNREGLTILMITHDLDYRDLVGNKILALEDGVSKVYPTAEYIAKFHPTHEVVDGKKVMGQED